MAVTVIYDLLEQAGGSMQAGMSSTTRSCIVNGVTGIPDALNAVSLGSTYNGWPCTNISVQANLPDNQAVRLQLTYTMNSGFLQESGSLKAEQWSYDKNGQVVNVSYTTGGVVDAYTAQFNKQNPLGVFVASRYEQADALTQADGQIGTVNKAVFFGYPKDLVMLVASSSTMVAPGWFNNSYTFVYDQYGFNARIVYFNRWGKIPKNIQSPGIPPQPPGNGGLGGGWVIVDTYVETDFHAGSFAWVEALI